MVLLTALLFAVVPARYDLTLTPHEGWFAGAEQLEVEVRRPVRSIRLDSVGLVVTGGSVEREGKSLPFLLERTADALLLRGRFPAGRLVIHLRWRGVASADGFGFHMAGGSWFTQLEPDHARQVFPCFDQPALRAPFRVHAVVAVGQEAVSNGALVGETVDGSLRRLDFAETPPLPSYLVALAVGRFESVEARVGEVPLRVLAPPGNRAAAEVALATTADVLERLQRFLGVPYPFAKLDVVAAVGLPVRAMENAGAIFVRADDLLRADRVQTRRLAHELAHQWFGDLVTMASWRDLWLSEALARWVEFAIVDEARPEWQMWAEFQHLRDQALRIDSRHPIRALRPSFDEITYDKGAAVMWMLQDWMGKEPFRDALHDYLVQHRLGVADADDFWSVLAAHSTQQAVQLGRSWLDRAGHPTLEVESRCQDGGALWVRLEQKSRPAWPLPVRLETPSGTLRLLLRGQHQTILLREPGGCPAWVTADGEQPYPVRYSERYSRVMSASSRKPTMRPASSVTTSSRAP
jgi:puromycin-sensitive aminopeptidase